MFWQLKQDFVEFLYAVKGNKIIDPMLEVQHQSGDKKMSENLLLI